MERGNLLLQLLYHLLLLSQEAAPSVQQQQQEQQQQQQEQEQPQQQTALRLEPPVMLMAGSPAALDAATIGVPFGGLQDSQLQAAKESFPLHDVLPEQLILMVLQSLFLVLGKPADKRVLEEDELQLSYLVVPLEGDFSRGRNTYEFMEGYLDTLTV